MSEFNRRNPSICSCCKGSLLFGDFFCYLPTCKNYLNSLHSKEYEDKLKIFNIFLSNSTETEISLMRVPEKKNSYSGYYMIKFLAKKRLNLKLSDQDIYNIKLAIKGKNNKVTRDEFLSLCKNA